MMSEELKLKKKQLDKKHLDFFYDVSGFLSKQNLSRYAFFYLRDDALNKIYDAQNDGTPLEKIFHRGYEYYYQKKINHLPKKSISEKIGGFLFAFFMLFFALALFVYIYRLVVKVPGFYYAEGMYLYITAQNAGSMFIYGFLGALLSILIQKNDKKTKNIMLIGTAIIGIAVIATFYAIGANYTKALKINIIIALIICLLLSGGGFILELLVSKKKKKLITQDN